MRTLLAVKLRRDLRASWSRFALMIIAIAVSLAAFEGVLAAWAGIGGETAGAYARTEPASATLVLRDGLEPARMADLLEGARRRPGVLGATGRTQLSSRIQVGGHDRSIPLQVFVAAADDPMTLVRFDLGDAGWPPSPGEIVLSEDSFDLLGLREGDSLTMTAPTGQQVEARVAGATYDPSLAPSPQDQTGHGYLALDTLAAAGAPALLDQVKVQVADPGETVPSRDRDTVVRAAQDLARWLEREQGVPVAEVQVPTPYAHPHQFQADALFTALLVAGILALLLSTVLVVTMLSNLFTRQIPQIGIMKAIGARSAPITVLYLTMVLVVAAAATALAVVPGLLIGRALLGGVLDLLGIQPVSLDPPWWTIPVTVLLGLGLPLVLASWPLARTSRITVRQAIDHHGGAAPTNATTRWLARLGSIPRMNRGLLLGMRNTVRRPARSLLAIGLLATAGTVFIAGLSLGDSMNAVTAEQNDARTWDVDVSLGSPAAAALVLPLVQRLPGVDGVEGWSVTSTGLSVPGAVPVTRTYPDQGHGRIGVIAVPAGTKLFTPPDTILEGRWLRPDETGAIVLSQTTLKNTLPGLHAGDSVQLSLRGRPVTWRVVGIVQEREGGGAYTTASGLAAALGATEQVNQLRIVTRGHDETSRTTAARAVQSALSAAGVSVGSATSVSRLEAAAAGHAGPLVTMFVLLAVVFAVVGGIGLATTMGANVLDRIREFGILHAIGARPRTVRGIVTAEGFVLTLVSLLVMVIPALLLIRGLSVGLGTLFMNAPLPYRISLLGVGAWVLLAVLGTALGTNAAAVGAARITIRQALDR